MHTDFLEQAPSSLFDEKEFKTKKELDRAVIRSLAGTYSVTFKFAETFSPNPDYEFHDRHYSEAKELAFILYEDEDKISIQHILFVGEKVIKHWRQDWVYENREFLKLVKDHHWKKICADPEKVKGTWTQKVFQVDDCPRYEGYGTWIHADGRHFWESTADAALPRREITKRNDYNILRRNSHIEVFADGSWLLEQDNEKIFRDEQNNENLICLEKGLERFTPDNYDVTETLEWWEERKAFWTEVRLTWEEFMRTNEHIKITEDEKLYFGQFGLAEQFAGEKYNAQAAQKAIRELLAKHVDGFIA